MTRRRPALAVAERFAAAATVAVGWLAVVEQLVRDGLVSGGGTLWLAALAAVATAGALTLFAAERTPQHGLRALGLGLTALSPTVFLYLLNIVVLALAGTELALATASERRPWQPSSTS
jgi:hypothetical protein